MGVILVKRKYVVNLTPELLPVPRLSEQTSMSNLRQLLYSFHGIVPPLFDFVIDFVETEVLFVTFLEILIHTKERAIEI